MPNDRSLPLVKRPPCIPVGLHWLGEREASDNARCAMDMRGCVMYFDRQSDCLQFMRWMEQIALNVEQHK
jgi:hypothetical protein